MKSLNAQVFLKRSKGLGDGVVGYGLHLTPSDLGPKIVSVTSGGEAARTGLISVGVRAAQQVVWLTFLAIVVRWK